MNSPAALSAHSKMNPRACLWLKVGILTTLCSAAILYLIFLADFLSLSDQSLALRASGYVWSFRVDFSNAQRWIFATCVMLMFIMVSLDLRTSFLRRASGKLGASYPDVLSYIVEGLVLGIALWAGIYKAFNMAGWDWFFIISTGVMAAGLMWIIRHSWIRSKISGLKSRSPELALLVITATALLLAMFIVHRGHAILTDAQSQIAQARLILSGNFRILLSEPLLHAAHLPNFVRDNPTYSQYPPGHIALLLPFEAVGLPANVLNVLCGLVTAFFTYRLCALIAGQRAAIFGGLLMAASPLFLVMQSSGMNHGSAMMMLTISAWAFYQVIWTGRSGLLWIGVLALGWAGITRPFTAGAHGLVWGALLTAYTGRRIFQKNGSPAISEMVRNYAVAAIAAAIPVGILLTYNTLTTGHPLKIGYQTSDLQLHRLGFFNSGPVIYTPLIAIEHVVCDVISLSQEMFGLPFSSWVLILGWLMVTRFSPGEMVITALIVVQSISYRFYHFYDLLMGPRFMSELMPLYAILGGIAVGQLFGYVSKAWRDVAAAVIGIFLVSAFVGGTKFWRGKLSSITHKHVQMESLMGKVVPQNQPLVVVTPDEYGETAGDYVFSKGEPTWFVSAGQEEKARRAPELQGFQWIHLPYRIP